MRFVIIGVAVLVGLGLAAFGGLTAFGVALPQLTAAAPSGTAPHTAAPLTRLASNEKTVPAQTPFHQLAQTADFGIGGAEDNRNGIHRSECGICKHRVSADRADHSGAEQVQSDRNRLCQRRSRPAAQRHTGL